MNSMFHVLRNFGTIPLPVDFSVGLPRFFYSVKDSYIVLNVIHDYMCSKLTHIIHLGHPSRVLTFLVSPPIRAVFKVAYPPTIFFIVPQRIINSVQFQPFWLDAHVFEKVGKNEPPFTDTYTSAPIAKVLGIGGVNTPSFHGVPYLIGTGSPHPMCFLICSRKIFGPIGPCKHFHGISIHKKLLNVKEGYCGKV